MKKCRRNEISQKILIIAEFGVFARDGKKK